jgi:ketosteroid isomerase-like protein
MRLAFCLFCSVLCVEAAPQEAQPTGVRSIDPAQATLHRELSEPGAGGKKVAAQLEQAEREWAAAVCRNDFPRLEQILATDLISTHSTGLVENKAQYLEALKSGRQKYDTIQFEEMQVRVRGEAAMVAAKVRMTGNTQGKPFDNRLRFLHVWKKAKGGWQLVGHQSARLPN